MLIGSFQHNVDVKGRLFVPAKWRDDLGTTFILTKGTDQCLFGMSVDQWNVITQKLAALPIADRQAQAFARHLSQWAIDCQLDKQGRILISQKLRSFAKLEGEVTLIGVNQRIEIWNSDIIQKQEDEIEQSYDQMLDRAKDWGI